MPARTETVRPQILVRILGADGKVLKIEEAEPHCSRTEAVIGALAAANRLKAEDLARAERECNSDRTRQLLRRIRGTFGAQPARREDVLTPIEEIVVEKAIRLTSHEDAISVIWDVVEAEINEVRSENLGDPRRRPTLFEAERLHRQRKQEAARMTR